MYDVPTRKVREPSVTLRNFTVTHFEIDGFCRAEECYDLLTVKRQLGSKFVLFLPWKR